MLRIGRKGHTNATGPESTSAMVRMPNLSGVHRWQGPRQTGAAVDYALELPAVPQESLQVGFYASQTAPTAASPGLTATPVASLAAVANLDVSQVVSVFGLSARRSPAVMKSQELGQ
jgi:hypothetical protein